MASAAVHPPGQRFRSAMQNRLPGLRPDRSHLRIGRTNLSNRSYRSVTSYSTSRRCDEQLSSRAVQKLEVILRAPPAPEPPLLPLLPLLLPAALLLLRCWKVVPKDLPMETRNNETDGPVPAKLPLPRIATASARSHRTTVSVERARVACDGCRKRRIKCSGNSPACFQCLDASSVCRYPAARRNRIKELEAQLEQTRESNRQLIKLVSDNNAALVTEMAKVGGRPSSSTEAARQIEKPPSRTSVYSLLNDTDSSSPPSSRSASSGPLARRQEALENMFAVIRSGDEAQITPLIEAIRNSRSPEDLNTYITRGLQNTPSSSGS